MSMMMPTPMPKPQEASILEGARTIRPYLPELVGPYAPAFDRNLAVLLERSRTGQSVANSIMELLSSSEQTRSWMQLFLLGQFNNYNPLVGDPNLLPPGKCACLYGDYVWYQQSSGDIPPICPTHGVSLTCG